MSTSRPGAPATRVVLESRILFKPPFGVRKFSPRTTAGVSAFCVYAAEASRKLLKPPFGVRKFSAGTTASISAFRVYAAEAFLVLGVAVQVEFERHILKPGLIFKGKGVSKPVASKLWVHKVQLLLPHLGSVLALRSFLRSS
jgi:hypothetical protein